MKAACLLFAMAAHSSFIVSLALASVEMNAADISLAYKKVCTEP